nr:ribonuclease H-like domain-containing protein [Tanacetum cinerariifolium]
SSGNQGQSSTAPIAKDLNIRDSRGKGIVDNDAVAPSRRSPHLDVRSTFQRLPFYCTPPTTVDAVIPNPTLEDLAIGTPSFKILAKAEASQKRKTSTSGATLSHVAKRTRAITTLEDPDLIFQQVRKKNDVKARTTLLLSLPDEHQLRFSKYKTARELWAAILKTFGGNEATKKRKKNLLKQQYGNFKAEGSESLEQTFNRLQVIVGLAPEWLMHTIVWRNMSDLDTMSLDDLYNHLKVYESEVHKKSDPNAQNMAFISSAKHTSRNEDRNTACVSTASTIFPTASASVASISQDTACAYIASQAPRSQERGMKDNYRQDSKVDEQTPKALMAIDGVGWDWSYMANKEEDHALVVDEKAPKEFALMANTKVRKEQGGTTPPTAQLYLSPKKDLSWTGLPEYADDTV